MCIYMTYTQHSQAQKLAAFVIGFFTIWDLSRSHTLNKNRAVGQDDEDGYKNIISVPKHETIVRLKKPPNS